MGAGLSQEDEPEEPLTEEKLDDLFSKPLDPKSAFEAAFANDSQALAGIQRIVKLLEQAPNPDRERQLRQQVREANEKLQLLQELAEKGNESALLLLNRLQSAMQAERQQERAERVAERQGFAAADDWLEEQLRKDWEKAELAQTKKIEAEKHMGLEEASRQAAIEEHSALEEASRQAAIVEMEAREALRKNASEAAQIRFEDAQLLAQQAKVKLEGLKAISAPQRPRSPGNGEAAELPERPPELPRKLEAKRKEGPVPEFYLLLDVSEDATFEEIKKGYRKQALKWHPDKNRQCPNEAADRFKKISEAFDTLYDPEKRERYDSGNWQNASKNKLKKLRGHGWASIGDEDDSALTPMGLRYKKKSWEGYVFYGGRIDDDENDLIWEDSDPRLPLQKVKIFWRHLAEQAHKAKNLSESDWDHKVNLEVNRQARIRRPHEGGDWMADFIASVWKDTPSRWPKAPELQNMNETSRQEWKERRMVYNRRKEKMVVYLKMYSEYLAIPGRKRKEAERLKRMGIVAPDRQVRGG